MTDAEIMAALNDRDRLRAELAAIRTAVAGYADADDSDTSAARTRTADAVCLMWDELQGARAELERQKRLNLELAERLAACAAVLGRAAERGKVCGCQSETVSPGAGESPNPPPRAA